MKEALTRIRKVANRIYYVESYTDATDGPIAARLKEVKDTADGKKWIAASGVDGASYRIIAETYRCTVKATTVTKRVLA